jgi:flagellar hook-length control protein FliK
MKRLLVAVATLAAAASGAAGAETIYRCGNEYTDVTCAHATTLVVADAVTPEQRAEARDVARRERTLAAEMTRDRREQEALMRPALAASLSAPRAAAAPPASAAKKHAKKHAKKAAIDEERDFVTIVPKAQKPGS